MIASICTEQKCVPWALHPTVFTGALITALRVREQGRGGCRDRSEFKNRTEQRDETAGGRLRRAYAHNFLERDFGARLLLARVLGC